MMGRWAYEIFQLGSGVREAMGRDGCVLEFPKQGDVANRQSQLSHL